MLKLISNDTKVTHGAIAGSITTIIISIAEYYGYSLGAELAAALTTLCIAILQMVTTSKQKVPTNA